MTPQQVSDLAFPIEVGLLVLLTIVLVIRVVRHWVAHRRVPLLLRRDVGLIGLLTVLIVVPRVMAQLGVRLAGELWWVVVINAGAIVVLLFWLGIELGIVGRDGGTE